MRCICYLLPVLGCRLFYGLFPLTFYYLRLPCTTRVRTRLRSVGWVIHSHSVLPTAHDCQLVAVLPTTPCLITRVATLRLLRAQHARTYGWFTHTTHIRLILVVRPLYRIRYRLCCSLLVAVGWFATVSGGQTLLWTRYRTPLLLLLIC